MLLYLEQSSESDFNSYFSDENNLLDFFGNLSYINIFVGSNNSGKSRFLRALIKKNDYVFVDNLNFRVDINEGLKITKRLFDSGITFFKIGKDRQRHNPEILKKENLNLFNLMQKYYPDMDGTIEINVSIFEGLLEILNNLKNKLQDEGNGFKFIKSLTILKSRIDFMMEYSELNPRNYSSNGIYIHFNGMINNYRSDLIELVGFLNKIEKTKITNIEIPNKVFIPILRTAWKLILNYQKDSTNIPVVNTNIFKSTLQQYFDFDELKVDIFTGMDLYDILNISQRHKDQNIMKNAEEFEEFLSKIFFDNKKVRLVPVAPTKENQNNSEIEKQIKINIEGDSYRELFNLGDGINSIIILMYKIFIAEKESWVFIEEPEQNLHPAFQRIFIENILKNEIIINKNLKFFFTTHSNHLLDLSMVYPEDISIFTFEKQKSLEEQFLVNNVRENDLKILKLLGVQNSSVFISNCSIWVEGITDRRYIKAYLNALNEYDKTLMLYKEDLHYSFFEYAGSNIEHYIFGEKDDIEKDMTDDRINSKYLSNRILLIADKDRDTDAKKAEKHLRRLNKISDNIQYVITIGKEIENYLSPEMLNKILPKFNRTFKLSKLKSTNLIHKEYLDENIGLGKYLDEKYKVSISESNGSLNSHYKSKFSEYIEDIVTWDNMGEPAQEFIKGIYKFIKESNQ